MFLQNSPFDDLFSEIENNYNLTGALDGEKLASLYCAIVDSSSDTTNDLKRFYQFSKHFAELSLKKNALSRSIMRPGFFSIGETKYGYEEIVNVDYKI